MSGLSVNQAETLAYAILEVTQSNLDYVSKNLVTKEQQVFKHCVSESFMSYFSLYFYFFSNFYTFHKILSDQFYINFSNSFL